MRCHSVHDLAAAEGQYHVRCYDNFRKVPVQTDQILLAEDEALKMLINNEMYVNQNVCTWTSIELHDKYVSFGGMLTRKQMYYKLLTQLREEVVVLRMEGCSPIVGFREFVGKIVKIKKVASEDEEKEDALVHTIITETRAIPHNINYDLSDFTPAKKTKQHIGATLLRFVSKLISNGEVTRASLSLSPSPYSITSPIHGIKQHLGWVSYCIISVVAGTS